MKRERKKKAFCSALSNSQELYHTWNGISNIIFDLKLLWFREDEDSWIHSTYEVYVVYLLDSTNHCALIRQNIKADFN